MTAGVSIHHLTLNDLDVGDYRTFFKLTPPLRAEEDRLAVVEAVASGLIDIISSFHTPPTRNPSACPSRRRPQGPWRWKPCSRRPCACTMRAR